MERIVFFHLASVSPRQGLGFIEKQRNGEVCFVRFYKSAVICGMDLIKIESRISKS